MLSSTKPIPKTILILSIANAKVKTGIALKIPVKNVISAAFRRLQRILFCESFARTYRYEKSWIPRATPNNTTVITKILAVGMTANKANPRIVDAEEIKTRIYKSDEIINFNTN